MKKILIILAVIISIICVNKTKAEGIVIPHESIRFRVIANSSSVEDQLLKNELTIYVEEYIRNLLKNIKSKEESLVILLNNKKEIEELVQNYLDMNNSNVKFNVSIGNNYFPEKEYKGIKYEAGYYDSLVISLGKSTGINWWCVIYPPLCLLDDTKTEVEYTSFIEEILSNYNM